MINIEEEIQLLENAAVNAIKESEKLDFELEAQHYIPKDG